MGAALVVALLSGTCACSRHGAPAAAPASAGSVVDSPFGRPPASAAGGACALLDDAQVRRVFPAAAAGKPRTDGLPYGLDRCAWEAPTGRIGLEVSKVEAGAFENELRSELTGFVDPRIEGASGRIRLQFVAGIGDQAFAVLEKADATRGILADIALLAVHRGDRMAMLMVSQSARDAQSPTRASLEDLGRAVARRL